MYDTVGLFVNVASDLGCVGERFNVFAHALRAATIHGVAKRIVLVLSHDNAFDQLASSVAVMTAALRTALDDVSCRRSFDVVAVSVSGANVLACDAPLAALGSVGSLSLRELLERNANDISASANNDTASVNDDNDDDRAAAVSSESDKRLRIVFARAIPARHGRDAARFGRDVMRDGVILFGIVVSGTLDLYVDERLFLSPINVHVRVLDLVSFDARCFDFKCILRIKIYI